MKSGSSWFKKERRFLYLSIFPPLIIIGLIGLVPLAYMFILSLKDLNLIRPPAKFVGLFNYIHLLHNPRYIHALTFTIVFALTATVTELVYGFFVAYILADKEISGAYSSAMRTLILIPFVVAPVVISYMFRTLIYDPTFGYLNYFLRILHLPTFDVYHGSMSAPIGIFAMEVILRTPFIIIILYAGISTISPSIFDAAQIDGASWFRQITEVIIPIIRPIIAVAFVFRFMDALKIFDEIFVVTKGGPGYVTESLSVFAVKHGFEYFRMGYAAASAFIFLVLVILLISLCLKIAKLE
jgi:multiple sugar transport system permease protein